MKKCPTCQEDFADKFSYCPVDATPLSSTNGAAAPIVNSVAAATPPAASLSSPVQSQFTENTPPIENNFVAADNSTSTSFRTSAAPGATSDVDHLDEIEAYGSAAAVPAVVGEYHLTILEDTGIARRLGRVLSEVKHDSELTWPEFKRDPFGFIGRVVTGYGRLGWRFLQSENVGLALVAAFAIVFVLIGVVFAFDRLNRGGAVATDAVREDLQYLGAIAEIPEQQDKPDPGTAGNNRGDGGGSKPKFERPAGGGGGGRAELKPASAGKLPQASLEVPQIVAPDPRPPTIKNPSLPVPATINADPKLFPPDARPLPYGDPKSRSTEVSSGPGTGNGIGTGTGGGVGSGEGGGVGPGRGGNTGGGDMRAGGGGAGGGGGGGVYAAREVTTKAVITFKPEPAYTEEARKNNVTGTVVLRAVLGANGRVSGVVPVQRLPYGLTEKAIAAAQLIRFQPATKEGRAVGQYVRIEYNFNMY